MALLREQRCTDRHIVASLEGAGSRKHVDLQVDGIPAARLDVPPQRTGALLRKAQHGMAMCWHVTAVSKW
jgi:hypothetical protein